MAHKNDVIFTEQGLIEFIQLIKQNPEMITKIRAASNEEIIRYNELHPTLREGYIPGKGIVVEWADGSNNMVYTGSKIEIPAKFVGHEKDEPGTITFIVDEQEIVLPLSGIVNVLPLEGTTEIPNTNAVLVAFEDFREDLDGILNGAHGDRTGYGFIPGYYTSLEKSLSEENLANLNLYLSKIELANKTNVYNTTTGVVCDANNVIAHPNELVGLIKEKENILSENSELAERDKHRQQLTIIESQIKLYDNQINELTTEKSNIKNDIDNIDTSITERSNAINKITTEKNNDLQNLIRIGLSINSTLAEVNDKLFEQGELLIDLSLFDDMEQITYETVFNKKSEYYVEGAEEQPETFQQLNTWLVIYNVQQKFITIETYTKEVEELNKLKQELEDGIAALDTKIQNLKDKKEPLATQQASEKYLLDFYTEKVASIEEQLSYISQAFDLINIGADRTWTVIKTQSTSNHEIASIKAEKVYGAVYNDYAEYRIAMAEAGQCVVENGDGTLAPSTQRLQLGGNIVSDTFGFAIGQTLNAKCPIAVCGRVLAYPNEPAWTYSPGAAVCSGPNGTVSLMTREEIKEWPDAIIGYVSEVPTYDTWGTDNIKVNGRIWIKVK